MKTNLDIFYCNISPYLLSVITIYSVVLSGNKDNKGWLLSIFNQSLWLLWIIVSNTWGLLPMNIVLTVVFIRNYRKWRLEEFS